MIFNQIVTLNLSTGDMVYEYGYGSKSNTTPRIVPVTGSYFGFYTKMVGSATNRYTRYGIMNDRSAMGLLHSESFSIKTYKLLLLNKIKRIVPV